MHALTGMINIKQRMKLQKNKVLIRILLSTYANMSDIIINSSNSERMSILKEYYLLFTLDKTPKFYNASYKTVRLKAKLMK